MGFFLKALNLTIAFFSLAVLLQSIGFGMFSDAMFTPFGVLFFFAAFWNEMNMIYL
ncbi:MAG: hypothetical protein HY544_05130 [Candidatus Diapherotrites archaeon]|uniref:Uncharacterized protein n=1 Tax=Candidatus Iainarchaeum sp. TaxID=3101447 RepID=A0A8T3YQ37_9ARCH|nr:hypothetical protein [Candidatus Diapherotrites archaeon]